MSTYVIPDKVRATVERLYEGAERTRVISALEAGKTVYVKGLKLKAKVKDNDEGAETPPAVPPKDTDKTVPRGTSDKDKGKDSK
jgi:hypothetical protein